MMLTRRSSSSSESEVGRYIDGMSEQPEKYSSPTSSARLLIRGVVVVALIIATIVALVWYANR